MRHILLFSLLAFSSYAQSVGDFSLNYKANATGPLSIKSWAKANSTLWGTNSSGNPQSITLGSGLSLTSGVLSSSASGGTWGSITGTLSAQTDLQTALDAKQSLNANLTTLSAGFGFLSGLVIWDGAEFAKQTSALSTGLGGTGISTYSIGDLLYGSVSGLSKLSGNTTTTKKFLTQTGDGTSSAAPAWETILAADVPTLNQNTTGTAAGLSATLAVASGGTGITSFGTGVATWLGAPTTANLSAAISDDDPAYIGTAQTFSQAQTFSRSGAASVSAVSLTGTPFSGGTSTTNFPLFAIIPASGATTVTNWSAYGTAMGLVMPEANTLGNFMAFIRSNTIIGEITSNGRMRGFEANILGQSGLQCYTSQSPSVSENTSSRAILLGAVASGLRMSSGYSINWSSSAAGSADAFSNLDIGLARNSAGVLRVSNGSSGLGALNTGTLTVGTSGTAFAQIKRYSLTMVAGTVTQADTAVTANTLIIADRRTVGGTIGHINTSVSAGSSFSINSSSSTETSTFTITVIVFP